MRAFNVFLALAVSALIAGLVFEGGLRLLGFGPPNTGLRFDAQLGWALKPNSSFENESKAGEFDVTVRTDAHGLRDDYTGATDKPDGVFRVLCLGDSFTLGYTVDRDDLFVDLLENWWQAEGRKVEVINAGVQGYSTDQMVRWLEVHGAEWSPDLVLLLGYENDLYWNLRSSYSGSSKPQYGDDGKLVEAGPLEDTSKRTALERTAIGNLLLRKKPPIERAEAPGTGQTIMAEQVPLLVAAPPLVEEATRRTAAILRHGKSVADALGAKFVVCPIPSHSQVDETYAVEKMGKGVLRIDREAWDPSLPYEILREAAVAAGVDAVLDPLADLGAAESSGEPQYYAVDWHLAPNGNRTLARHLHTVLDERAFMPAAVTAAELPDAAITGSGRGIPGWFPWFLGLWAALGTLYVRTYSDESVARGYVSVGLLLGAVFTIAIGGSTLLGTLPPKIAQVSLLLVVFGILSFVLYKLGSRVGTAAELLRAFVLRGHWYLMPLLTILVTIGSLLVVAASSPLIAPFIYTLF